MCSGWSSASQRGNVCEEEQRCVGGRSTGAVVAKSRADAKAKALHTPDHLSL